MRAIPSGQVDQSIMALYIQLSVSAKPVRENNPHYTDDSGVGVMTSQERPCMI
jgi:hypothetical protein